MDAHIYGRLAIRRSRLVRTIIIILALSLSCTGFIFVPINAEARTTAAYYKKPVLSVVGDSISSYYGYEVFSLYGPEWGKGLTYMPQSDMWWSRVAYGNNYDIGYPGGVVSGKVSLSDNQYLSLRYQERLNKLDSYGAPDYIAVYGGTNDASNMVSGLNFLNSYRALVNKLHSMYDGVKLILMAPGYFLNSQDNTRSSDYDSMINTYANSIAALARENNDYFVDLRGATDTNCDLLDSVHPNNVGMFKIAGAFMNQLNSQRGSVGIESIRAGIDYDYYIIKVNAYSNIGGLLRYRFRLTDDSTGEVIYDTDWSYNNCYELHEVNPWTSYTAYAEIDSNNDGKADDNMTKTWSYLTPKRVGTTIYNGVDYSRVYNYNYYVETYPDLYNAFKNSPSYAIEHFVTTGMNEGRRGNESFDVRAYRNRYSDLRRIFGWNDLSAYYHHYINCGYAEGRSINSCDFVVDPIHDFCGVDFSPIYDYDYYRKNNPDVVAVYGDDDIGILGHFIFCGMREGRQGSAEFNVFTYAGNYPDLINAFFCDLPQYYLHYLLSGKAEGRVGS